MTQMTHISPTASAKFSGRSVPAGSSACASATRASTVTVSGAFGCCFVEREESADRDRWMESCLGADSTAAAAFDGQNIAGM